MACWGSQWSKPGQAVQTGRQISHRAGKYQKCKNKPGLKEQRRDQKTTGLEKSQGNAGSNADLNKVKF